MVSPLGLGREESISSWRDLHSGTGETTSALLPNKRWPTEGFPRRDAGLVVGFNARKQLPDRKATKLMSRESQLAVYAAVEAGAGDALDGVPAEDIGAFATAGYEVSSLPESEAMLAASRREDDPSRLSLAKLFGEGRDCYNPLSPLKILPNMPLFHATSTLGLRGPHLSLGSSPASGLVALGEASDALADGDCERALVLGSDCQLEEFRAQLLVEAQIVPSLAPAEGAVAMVLGRSPTPSTKAAACPSARLVAWEAGQQSRVAGKDLPAELYSGLIEASGQPDLIFSYLWGLPDTEESERTLLRKLGTRVVCTRPMLGWMGAAHGLLDVALGVAEIEAGNAQRVLVTARGVLGDIAAVMLEAGVPV